MKRRESFKDSESQERGFTIVELILATAISGILATVMFTICVYYYGSTLQAQTTAQMALESQLILTQLVEDIRLSDGIALTNSIADVNAPAGGWVTNDPSNIIIVKSPATDAARDIIYDSSTNFPYRNEFIYFTTGATMYRRTLKNTDATGNTAITTCPPAIASSSCPSDKEFSKNMNNLTFTFYDINDAATSDPTLARSVNLTVNMTRKVYGKTLTLSNSTRTTLRNY
jgi:prepilin-type N-terminal cleavage/methylation domain-containing protein